jgi:hypothetical protein
MIALDTVSPDRRDAFDSLWRFSSSSRVTLVLVALLVATLGVALMLPQLPTGLDGAATERWFGAATASYRGLGALLRAVGAFDILQGPWLRILLACLVYNLALRLADHLRCVRGAWRTVTAPPPFPPGLPAERIARPEPLEQALTIVSEVMRPHYPGLVSQSEAGQARVYGRRRRPGVLGAPALSLGLLLLLSGLVVNGLYGWHTDELALAVKGSAGVAVDGGLQFLLDSIAGEGSATRSAVVVTRSDGRQERLAAGFLRPARSGSLWLAQRAVGPALQARAHGADRPLLLRSLAADSQLNTELNVPLRETSELAFAIPDRNLALRVVSYAALPEQGFRGPVFLVEAYRGDGATPLLTQLVESSASLTIEDITVDLRRERYAVLVAAYLPGLGLIALGLLLGLAGLITLRVWGYTETWANLMAGRDGVTVIFRSAAPWRPRAECARLAEAALAAPAPAPE